MKANNGSGNNITRDEWETPKWLFDAIHIQYKFSFDCCATLETHKCYGYSSDFEKYLGNGDIRHWMNPPFSKAEQMFKHFFKVVAQGVAIYRCDNLETKVWQEVILPNTDWVFIPNKRIAYEGLEGTGSRFPSALIGVGVPPIESLAGITLRPSGRLTRGFQATSVAQIPAGTSESPIIVMSNRGLGTDGGVQ